MCMSIFYAQVIGLWLFLVALAMLVHQARFKKTVMESLTHHSLMAFSGLVALGLGLVIVVNHNIWVSAWPVLITLFGWVLILHGIFRIFWPDHFARIMKDVLAKSGYTVLSWIWLIVGAYLLYVGFMANN